MAVILVVDDEVGIRELLSEILSDEGYDVQLAENAAAARAVMQRGHPDLVLLDIWMPDNDGVSLLKEWNSLGQLDFPVIMMSGHATLDTAIEATRYGAVDFVEKPFAMARLISSVQTALDKRARLRPVYSRPYRAPAPQPQPQPVAPAPAAQERKPHLGEGIDFNAPLREARDQFERIYFTNLLNRENASMTRVATCSGLERTHLYRKLKQLGLEVGKAARNRDPES